MSSPPDPVATLQDAWRRARESLSFTSFRGWQETSTHHLHIAGYSTVRTLYKQGKGVKSTPFSAGGHRWNLTYYPNGDEDSRTGNPAVGLKLLDSPFGFDVAKATAGHTVSMLHSDGNVLCSRSVPPQDYKAWKSSGVVDVGKRDATAALRQLKDDSLVVRCDVTVHRSAKESRLRWLLRRFLD